MRPRHRTATAWRRDSGGMGWHGTGRNGTERDRTGRDRTRRDRTAITPPVPASGGSISARRLGIPQPCDGVVRSRPDASTHETSPSAGGNLRTGMFEEKTPPKRDGLRKETSTTPPRQGIPERRFVSAGRSHRSTGRQAGNPGSSHPYSVRRPPKTALRPAGRKSGRG